jgi:hypothetical protein
LIHDRGLAIGRPQGQPLAQFLERIENQEINGVTATHIVSEVAHRLMTIEGMQAFGYPGTLLQRPKPG